MKIVTWNVNGLRSVASKGVLAELVEQQRPDILCVQEIKCTEDVAIKLLKEVGFEHVVVAASKKAGYAGVAMACRAGVEWVSAGVGLGSDIDVRDFDDEGRIVTVSFANGLVVVGCYTPNSKPKLERLDERVRVWEPAFRKHLNSLGGGHLIVVGDLNVAPCDMDVHDPRRLAKSPGFTPEERAAFSELLDATGMVDAFRALHPNARAYSYWSYLGRARERNKGWRIDHVLAKKTMKLKDVTILSSVRGSDHCPIALEI